MQNGSIGLAGALVFASTMAIVGCSESAGRGDAGAGASSTGTGGADSSSGGVGGGGSSSGGVGGGGSSSGGNGSGEAGSGGNGAASSCTADEGGTAVTSLCDSAPLNTLTEAEATQLCSDTGAYVAGSVSRSNACKYAALVAAASSSAPTEEELQAACSTSESACNQDASSSMGPGALCSDIPATCTATVAQYSTCIVDETVLFDQGVSELVSCSMLTFANISTIYEVPDNASQAASCMALTTMCPGFFPPYIN